MARSKNSTWQVLLAIFAAWCAFLFFAKAPEVSALEFIFIEAAVFGCTVVIVALGRLLVLGSALKLAMFAAAMVVIMAGSLYPTATFHDDGWMFPLFLLIVWLGFYIPVVVCWGVMTLFRGKR